MITTQLDLSGVEELSDAQVANAVAEFAAAAADFGGGEVDLAASVLKSAPVEAQRIILMCSAMATRLVEDIGGVEAMRWYLSDLDGVLQQATRALSAVEHDLSVAAGG